MKPVLHPLALASLMLGTLAGCASGLSDRFVSEVNRHTQAFAGHAALRVAQPEAHRRAHTEAAERLLAAPLEREAAVAFALEHGPGMQALLAHHEALAADSEQSARPVNPHLVLERMRSASELELTRTLSIALFDLLRWPARRGIAEAQWRAHVAELAEALVQEVTEVRLAWIEAVAAQEALAYARQVVAAADASAELARRMQAVGNFNALARLRQQAFHAEAMSRLATAEQRVVSAREALGRKLGLSGENLARLRLPERLPELPKVAMDERQAEARAQRERLDLRLAHARLEAESRRLGIERLFGWTEVELGLSASTILERADGHRSRARGGEIALGLPILDPGDA
ncbi:MAG: TolC family protein, partial [Casimicrobiaceae bacterium]